MAGSKIPNTLENNNMFVASFMDLKLRMEVRKIRWRWGKAKRDQITGQSKVM